MKKYNINQFINLYFKKRKTITEISKITKIPPSTIKYQLKKEGYLLIHTRHGNNRKHNIDENFFKKIDSPNKAYILGLIISDGYVDNYSKLTFTSKDKELVEIFRNELKSEHKLAKYEIFDKRTNKSNVRYSLQIGSKEIINDLNKLGVYSNKSFNCKMPNVPYDLFWHFVRGVFDGDGCISKEKKQKNGRLRFSIIGSKTLILELKNKFKNFGLSNTKINITKHKSNDGQIVKILYYCFKDLNLIKNMMYENSNRLRLSRKYELFQTLKEHKLGQYDRTINLRKIEMYCFSTKQYINTFNNIHDACNRINSTYKMIHRVAMGERKQTKGYYFIYI